MTRNKQHLTVIPILGKVIQSYIILNYEKNSLSNFTHLNKIKWRIFIPVQKAWFVKKLRRADGPKKIPEFLSKGGVVQFCRLGGCFNLSRLTQIRLSTCSLFIGLARHDHIIVRLPQSLKATTALSDILWMGFRPYSRNKWSFEQTNFNQNILFVHVFWKHHIYCKDFKCQNLYQSLYKCWIQCFLPNLSEVTTS